MKNHILRSWPFLLIGALVISTIGLQSCDEATQEALNNFFKRDSTEGLGWWQHREDTATQEQDLNLSLASSSGSANLPSRVDLTDQLPPIRNQGRFGTCVTWALGYNMKTYMEARDQGLTTSQLSAPSQQFSPKDLFWAIPESEKGSDCNGTYFEIAFEQMIKRGIARMSTAPYDNLQGCPNNVPSEWQQDAKGHKIKNYRRIGTDRKTVKKYLAEGRIVGFGAGLGPDFMSWDSEDVLRTDAGTIDGQHANHAMVVTGYDDSKGGTGAFHITNSWGETWGADGEIWVSYSHFEDFAFSAYVANNIPSDPDADGDNQVDDDDQIRSAKDLVTWELRDSADRASSDPLDRVITYNVFNVGEQSVRAREDWSIVYMYYNAYNANEWGILLFDYYSDDFGSRGDIAPIPSTADPELQPGQGGDGSNYYNYVDVDGGESVSSSTGQDQGFIWSYTMPTHLNGNYYLALVADAYDDIAEHDESNNYFYISEANAEPIFISNGVLSKDYVNPLEGGRRSSKQPGPNAASPSPTPVSAANPNAYTQEEIRKLIDAHIESGALAEKVEAWKTQHPHAGRRKAHRKTVK